MFKQLALNTYHGISEDRCAQQAAALAYYTLFSLAPLLVIVITVTAWGMRASGFIDADSDVTEKVLNQLAGYVGEQPAEQIGSLIEIASKRDHTAWSTISSVIALVVGATAIMGQLQVSLNEIWGVKPDPAVSGVFLFLKKRLLSFGLILAIAFIMLVSLVLSTFIQAFNDFASHQIAASFTGWLPKITDTLLQLLVTTALFALIFKLLPDAEISLREVLFGAFVTAMLFLLGRHAIVWYLAHSEVESGFGAAGSLVILMMWIYYSALIFFVGAEFTKHWAKARGKAIVPETGAIQVKRETAATA